MLKCCMVTKLTVKILTVRQLKIGQACYLLNHPYIIVIFYVLHSFPTLTCIIPVINMYLQASSGKQCRSLSDGFWEASCSGSTLFSKQVVSGLAW